MQEKFEGLVQANVALDKIYLDGGGPWVSDSQIENERTQHKCVRDEDDGLNQAYAEYAEMTPPTDLALLKPLQREGRLIFDRDCQDSEAAFQRAVKADKAYGALWDITQVLRKYRKYHEFKSEEASDFFDHLDAELYDIITESGVDLDNEYF